MQVRIEDVSPVEKKMVVEVPWETVSEKLGVAYRELGKGVGSGRIGLVGGGAFLGRGRGGAVQQR